MASPCEFLIESQHAHLVQQVAAQGVAEVKRIEQKFSRYLPNNLCHAINHSNGQPVKIDQECHRLLEFGQTCYQLSEGLFDLTSGVLRKAWRFDGSDQLPLPEQVETLLPFVGWHKVEFDASTICLPQGMELDFGGIGKEYAVSRVAELARQIAPESSILINLGGDIQITRPRQDQHPWQIGIEQGQSGQAAKVLSIREGAIATSGDAKRYLLKDGIRYGHILNPQTGWPIQGAPASITTLAPLCIQAGCLATLALLQGKQAESFLSQQGVKFWSQRP